MREKSLMSHLWRSCGATHAILAPALLRAQNEFTRGEGALARADGGNSQAPGARDSLICAVTSNTIDKGWLSIVKPLVCTASL